MSLPQWVVRRPAALDVAEDHQNEVGVLAPLVHLVDHDVGHACSTEKADEKRSYPGRNDSARCAAGMCCEEDERGRTVQQRVLLQPAEQDAGGAEHQTRGFTAHRLQPDAVADRPTNLLAPPEQ